MTGYAALRWVLMGVLLVGGLNVLGPPQAGAAGATYYVSPNGNDSNPGTAPDQAWRTLARVQTAMPTLGSGAQVLFERGGTFAGSLDIAVSGRAGSPLIFGAYGSGERPVLSGLTTLTGWTAQGNNRWAVTCAVCGTTVNALWVDGVLQPLARWPNPDEGDGYRYYQSASGGTSITDNTLPDSPSWVGGEAVIRTTAWLLDRLPITSQTNGTLAFGASASYNAIQPGYGYFIQNHPAAMDRQGEWVYQPASKTLWLYSVGDPNASTVEVPTSDTVLRADGVAHVVLRDLTLRGANNRNLSAENCTNLTLTGLRNLGAGIVGARFINCRNLVVEGGDIRQALNHGLDVVNCVDCRVHHMTIADIALVAGMGQSYDGNYNGVRFGGSGSVFEFNRVDNTGYLGVDIRGPATVRNNHVTRFNQVKVDGAGIYTWGNSDVRILDNLITDGRGSTAGIPWEHPGTHGIYIDDDSQRIEVRGNTIARMGESGIYLHNTRAVTVEDNTIVAANVRQLMLNDDDLGKFGVTASVIRNNRFVATTPTAEVVWAGSDQTDGFFGQLGQMDANVYCNLFGPAVFERYTPSMVPGEEMLSLAAWRNAYGLDAASRECGQRFPEYGNPIAQGANLITNGTFESTIAPWFGWPDTALEAAWDAGRLRIRNNGQNDIVHIDNLVGAISVGQLYRARFTAWSNAEGRLLRVYLRQLGQPYSRLSRVVTLWLGVQPADYDVYLPAERSDAEGVLIFELPRASQVAWLDDVRLEPVSAQAVNPDLVVRLETNPSEVPRTVALGASGYTDLDGRVYPPGSTVTVRPYGSLVLVRQDVSAFQLRLPSVLRAR